MVVGAAVNRWSLSVREGGARCGWLRWALSAIVLGMTFAALAERYGLGLELVELWSFSAVLLALSLTDIDSYRIPNACVACALGIRLVYLAMCCATGAMGWLDVRFYLLSAMGVGAALAGIVVVCDMLLGAESMGGGDLKLFVVAAFYVGWAQCVLLVLVACVLGIISSPLFRKTSSEIGSAKPFPFGPSIALACVLTMLYGEQLVTWYGGLL